MPPDAFNWMLSPKHIVPSAPALAMMNGVITTVTESIPVQPLASVAITVYVALAVGEAVMEDVVCPLLQLYVFPPFAESVIAVPVHTVILFPALTVSPEFTVTVAVAVSEHNPLETITVKVEVEVKVKEMEDVVAPVLHE